MHSLHFAAFFLPRDEATNDGGENDFERRRTTTVKKSLLFPLLLAGAFLKKLYFREIVEFNDRVFFDFIERELITNLSFPFDDDTNESFSHKIYLSCRK